METKKIILKLRTERGMSQCDKIIQSACHCNRKPTDRKKCHCKKYFLIDVSSVLYRTSTEKSEKIL